jgi:lysozyme family protein
MPLYTPAFEAAVDHAMLYEVGKHWKLTPAVEKGLCLTPAERRATGYVNDPVDPGGETKFGIAKNANPDLNIKTLTWAQAKEVYHNRYWIPGRCDRLPPRLAVLHFDGCVNHGVTAAGRFLQRAVGATADGVIGQMTLARVAAADELQTCNRICDFRAQFYRNIVISKPSQAKFLRGWLIRIEEMRAFVSNPAKSFV